jgi:PAS domain S-box-containing protein
VIFQNSNQEIILANRQAESLLNFSLKSGKDRKKNIYADAVTEDGSPLTKENNPFFKASKTGQKTNGQILGIKNEKLKWILINSTPEFEPVSGQPAGVLSVMEDITELKAMEEELMKKNTELEQIFDTVPDAMVYADKTRKILKVNKSFTSLFQYMPDEVIGLSTSVLYNDQAEFNNQGKIRYNPHAPRLTAPYEVEYKRKNSQVFTGETVGSKLTDSKGRVIGMLALIRDVTEKRKIEAIINRSQKIESVGRIAGSIAHDFNNILTVISGYSELIMTKTSELPEINSQVQQISDAVSKAKKLTRHLLTFSRKQTLTFSKIDINELIRNFRDFLYPVLGRNISLYLSFSEQ